MEGPKCRYCGEVMMPIQMPDGMNYACPACYSTSPFIIGANNDSINEVTSAALRRTMQKPMTLEELMSDGDADDEGTKVAYHERRSDGAVIAALISAEYRTICYEGDDMGEWIEESEYGRTWRCWRSRPTDEERKAADWDEI